MFLEELSNQWNAEERQRGDAVAFYIANESLIYLKVEIMICLCKTLCSSTRAHFLARRSKGMNVIDLDGSDYN